MLDFTSIRNFITSMRQRD